MRSAVFWLALVLLAGPSLGANAAAAMPDDEPISECEQTRRDWAADNPSKPPENDINDRLAYLRRSSDTRELRFDLNCDRRLSFEEYLPLAWEGWRWKDANEDGVVTRAEYVTYDCTVLYRALVGQDPAARAVCERASASNYRDVAGYGRTRVDQQGYRFTAYLQFRRADKNRDRYLTRTPNSADYYE